MNISENPEIIQFKAQTRNVNNVVVSIEEDISTEKRQMECGDDLNVNINIDESIPLSDFNSGNYKNFVPIRISKREIQDRIINRMLPYRKTSNLENNFSLMKTKNFEFYSTPIDSLPKLSSRSLITQINQSSSKEHTPNTITNSDSQVINYSNKLNNFSNSNSSTSPSAFIISNVSNPYYIAMCQNMKSNTNVNIPNLIIPKTQPIYSDFSYKEITEAIEYLRNKKADNIQPVENE
jgi:hypothetical protein